MVIHLTVCFYKKIIFTVNQFSATIFIHFSYFHYLQLKSEFHITIIFTVKHFSASTFIHSFFYDIGFRTTILSLDVVWLSVLPFVCIHTYFFRVRYIIIDTGWTNCFSFPLKPLSYHFSANTFIFLLLRNGTKTKSL